MADTDAMNPTNSRAYSAIRRTMLLRIFVCLPLAAAFLVAGCGHYQLGRHADPPFSSLYIKPVANDSFAPQAQALLTTQIREAILRDGLLELRDADNADATLEVVLKDFDKNIAATSTDDTGIADKLRLGLSASCTLIDNRDGTVFMKGRTVRATADSFPEESSARAEYQAMPVLTERLARRVANEVLQVW